MAGSPGDSVFTQDQANAVAEAYETDFFTVQPLLEMIQEYDMMEKRGGDRLTVDYLTNMPDGYSYGRDSVLQATQKGEMVRAIFDWGAFAMDTKEFGWDIENQGEVGKLSTGTLRKLMTHRIDILKAAFSQRLPARLWQGAGAAYNGGDGVDFTGIESQVPASPSSATVGGLSWSTYDELQSQSIAGTSGPSTDWEADAWERLLTLRVACWHPRKKNQGMVKGFVCYTTRASYVDIIQLAYNQNTNVGAEVKDIVSVGGVVPHINDTQDANTVYLLKPDTWKLYTPPGRKGFIELDVRDNLEERINKKDSVAVMTAKGCLVNMFPPQNGVITSAG